MKQTDLAETHKLGAVYEPYSFSTDLRLLVRASVPVNTLIPSVKKGVREIDSEIPIENFKTLQTYINESLIARRSPAILAGIFAGVALLLAAIGTYGQLSSLVASRRRELGVRIALGADQRRVIAHVMSQGLRLAGTGIAIGTLGALGVSRVTESLLFGVRPTDTATLVAVGGTVLAASVLACCLPACRATRVDPNTVLRAD